MRALLTLPVLALAVSACDQPAPEPQKPQARVQSAEQKRLHTLNEMDRAITLKKAVFESGFRCQRVERSGYVTEYENLSMWMASCSDKRDWAIFVGPDSSAQVRLCKDVVRYGLPPCVIREDKAAPAT